MANPVKGGNLEKERLRVLGLGLFNVGPLEGQWLGHLDGRGGDFSGRNLLHEWRGAPVHQ